MKAAAPTEVLYPELVVRHHYQGADGPITLEMIKKWMRIESEEEWAARMKSLNPGLEGTPTFASAKDEDGKDAPVDCIESPVTGFKYVAWANLGNRELDVETCMKYAQSILKRQWAGPTTIPGETVNGESMIVSRTGMCQSMQHRAFGLLFATEQWHKDPLKWKVAKYWPDSEPVIESLVVFGISDNPKVVQTLDEVKARSEADVIFTSPMFAGKSHKEKGELSKMASKAFDICWTRTGAAGNGDRVYKNNQEMMDWVRRHGRLLECVQHCFEENQKRAITMMKLPIGEVAGLMYLMATAASDGDAYRKLKPDVRSEKKLNFDHWDQASDFIVMLANQGTEDAIRSALADLIDEEEGTKGRPIEKKAILAKAWKMFSENREPTFEECRLTEDDYEKDKDGVPHLKLEVLSNFGGIDGGDKRPGFKRDDEVDPKQAAEDLRIAERKKKAEFLAEKLKNARKTGVKDKDDGKDK